MDLTESIKNDIKKIEQEINRYRYQIGKNNYENEIFQEEIEKRKKKLKKYNDMLDIMNSEM